MNKKWPRQPNQHKIRYSEEELTQTAEKLLEWVKKYQYTYNVTMSQYAALLEISWRNTAKAFAELIKKGKIEVFPENRRRGRGRANSYRVIEPKKSDPDSINN